MGMRRGWKRGVCSAAGAPPCEGSFANEKNILQCDAFPNLKAVSWSCCNCCSLFGYAFKSTTFLSVCFVSIWDASKNATF